MTSEQGVHTLFIVQIERKKERGKVRERGRERERE
jgi:hypothetical protein